MGDELLIEMTAQFGPLMGGEDLYRALGFRTSAAFRRALRCNQVSVRVFELPTRRGKFALTRDVAIWLEQLSFPNENESSTCSKVGVFDDREIVKKGEKI